MIYFDNAATTKINKKSLEDLYNKSVTVFGNPSTKYSIGFFSKKILNESRNRVATVLSCDEKDLFFTSGGTEGNNIVLQSVIRNIGSKKGHIICSSIEHKSILKTLDKIANNNIDITFIKPDANGKIVARKISDSIRKDTILICVQYINNELGTLQPINEISLIAKKNNVPMLVDAVQAVGHIKINLTELEIDYLTASAHKFGGPKGIGFLYAKNHNIGLCFGGGQERDVKSGTENVPSISAMSIALEEAVDNLDNKQRHISEMVKYLKIRMKKIEGLYFNVDDNDYNSMISFRIDNLSNEALINYFDMHGICVSAGSACLGNSFEHSHVLKSIGLSEEQIESTIRLSLSYDNNLEECKKFIDCLESGIKLLRIK